MNHIDEFVELVESVCLRPQMFCYDGSYAEVCAFFTGFASGSTNSPLSGKGWTAFNDFTAATFRFPRKYIWWYVIRESSRTEEEAIALLKSHLMEFAEKSRTQSYEEIIEHAYALATENVETAPVIAWRALSRALHRGHREEIEPLIQFNSNAEILWSSSCPADVGLLFDQIAESYTVSQISGSEADGEVTIITPDFGAIGVKMINGAWRVDVSKIIACWQVTRRSPSGDE